MRDESTNHDDPDILRADEPFDVGNEFAYVVVRKVYTRNGVRLEISSPKLGYKIRLDPLELESLTWQTTETFSAFLATPFGSDPEPGDPDEGSNNDASEEGKS